MGVVLRPRLFRLVGNDPDHAIFECDSWSGTGEVYEQSIDKRDFTIRCSCMGAACHHKVGNVFFTGDECKHITHLRKCMGDILSRV